jgi:hypothetical protein
MVKTTKPMLVVLSFLCYTSAPPSVAEAPLHAPQLFDGCPLEGDAQNASLKALNQLKNRTTQPMANQIDSNITLAAVLTPGNDINRWSSNQGAVVTGYVIAVKPGGPETVNCHAKDLPHTDTHIELALNPGVTEGIKHMIVEVTPRGRALMASKGKNWSTPNLHAILPGHRVTVTGWMMLDKEHCNAAENTNSGNPKNWRATCWEIHPVTGLAPAPQP